jgi:hypothetical protein
MNIRSKIYFFWRLCHQLTSRKQGSSIRQLVPHYFLFRRFAFSQKDSVICVPATVNFIYKVNGLADSEMLILLLRKTIRPPFV